MEQVKEWIDLIFNSKVGTALIIVFGLLTIALIIFSKTSLGKKALNYLKDKFANVQRISESSSKLSNETKKEFDELKINVAKALETYTNETDKKLSAVYCEYEELKNDIYCVLEQFPNAKVKEKLEELKNRVNTKEEDIKTILGATHKELNDELQLTYSETLRRVEDKNALLSQEITELKELVLNLTKVAETSQNNEIVEEVSDEQEQECTDTPNEVAECVE